MHASSPSPGALYALLKEAPAMDNGAPGPHRPASPATGEAAVLALLRLVSGRCEVLLIRRTERAGDPWSGHIALPGGRRDPRDAALLETALRETEEEVGLHARAFVGPPLFVGTRAPANRPWLHVSVFLDVLADAASLKGDQRNAEVAETFWAPIRALQPSERPVEVPSSVGRIQADALLYEGRVIWGFTRRVLLDLLDAYGPMLP